MVSQFFWKAGCILGATGLGLGAFGAHALTKYVGDNPKKIKNWAMASEFQIIHGVALLAISSVPASVRRIHPIAPSLILGGTLMFSGTIYLLTLQRERLGPILGPVTPLGGIAMMAGWAALLI